MAFKYCPKLERISINATRDWVEHTLDYCLRTGKKISVSCRAGCLTITGVYGY